MRSCWHVLHLNSPFYLCQDLIFLFCFFFASLGLLLFLPFPTPSFNQSCVFLHQVSKKYVSKELAKEIHAKAAPFVKWLKEAEEESEGSEEEEEEEDENVEVQF